MPYPSFIDYGVAVARDKTSKGETGAKRTLKYGRITELSTASSTIWDKNTPYTYLASTSTLKIASASGDDATAGSGALTVMIEGVDANYAEKSEIVTMAGTTAVTLTNDYLRVYRMYVDSVGSSQTNSGVLSLIPNAQAGSTFGSGVPTSTSLIVAQVVADAGQTLMTPFTVPATYTAYITEYHMSSAQTKVITSELWARPFGGAWRIQSSVEFSRNVIDRSFDPPMRFEAKTDLEFRAYASSTTGKVSAEYNMILTEGD